ncbi:hypothetical protein H072_7000 [Dactylellina haptotyla CBS 200.50]|uniref:YMC020W-like alpha/beta hydrolase domain-containing protein n=1 Tax=Dactylellina haptotyla (strain CBS 200.50) TaxID=1284197 RepID=S8BV59_DACHA|nr:hypothetical protein H072_7000 [Dactylellina haptotyla CBS 200.50]
MSRKRTKKTTTSSPSPSSSSTITPRQIPSAASSTTSVTSQATTTTHRDDASVAGSTMSRAAASALESTASVVHKVKVGDTAEATSLHLTTHPPNLHMPFWLQADRPFLILQTQVPEAIHAVAQNLPQRLPTNFTRLTSTKSTASTQVAQETAARTSSFSAPSRSSSRPRISPSPMSKVLSPPKPTIQLTSAPEDAEPNSSSQESSGQPGTENGEPYKSLANGANGTVDKSTTQPNGDTVITVTEPAEPKTTSSTWLSWWGTNQQNPAATNSTETPDLKPKAPPPPPQTTEAIMSKPPPKLPSIDNIKADNKTLHKVRSAENLGLRKHLNGSTTSIKTAPPSFIDPPQPPEVTITAEEPPKITDTVPIASTSAPQVRASWFGYWYGGTESAPPTDGRQDNFSTTATGDGANPADKNTDQIIPQENGNTEQQQENGSASLAIPEVPKPVDQTQVSSNDSLLARGAAWIWWPKPQAQTEGSKIVEAVEIAAAESSTQTDPQNAKLATQPPQGTAVPQKRSRSVSPNSVPIRPDHSSTLQPPSIPIAPKEVSPAAKTLQRVLPPNLLVPSFDSCFNPQKSRSWFGLPSAVNRFWSAPKTPSKTQLSIVPVLPQVRKAISIGVHGFFPTKLFQRVIGEPTGTSVRFATEGAAAIQRWADQHKLSVDIEKIPLEYEGRVSDRVEALWKLLEKKLDVIQTADFILVCCHSQGTPVGVHLIARMIEYGLVDKTKIGIIGMAGINLGPFVELNSRILTGSAKELFDFSNPTSLVSQQYIESLSAVLAHGVKLVFVGSIDDQLVSLYSSTFSNISHPFIYRAVFVDGRVHAPDFVSHVVGLALKLRNIGVRDHGIIRELSGPLAGSLYSGEGHSRIYDDAAIYDLGVRHALETNTKEFLRVPLKVEEFQLPSASNPYILPWAMRGMLEERRVLEELDLQEETQILLEEFAKWQPTSKVLKDVKFRLEAIRSKL